MLGSVDIYTGSRAIVEWYWGLDRRLRGSGLYQGGITVSIRRSPARIDLPGFFCWWEVLIGALLSG